MSRTCDDYSGGLIWDGKGEEAACRRASMLRSHLVGGDDGQWCDKGKEKERQQQRLTYRCVFSNSSDKCEHDHEPSIVVIGGLILDILARVSRSDNSSRPVVARLEGQEEEGGVVEETGELYRGGSTPGIVQTVQGGVGANVAIVIAVLKDTAIAMRRRELQDESKELAKRLGRGGEERNGQNTSLQSPQVMLITGIGRDAVGESLQSELAALGMETRGIVHFERERTPTLVSVIDGSGEVACSVADVNSLERAFSETMYEHDVL